MDTILNEERDVLLQKKDIIKQELKEKKQKFEEVGEKIKTLNKQVKSFSEEKQANERIFSYLYQDIEKYEESLIEPYFGRVDFRENMGFTESIYIGKKV